MLNKIKQNRKWPKKNIFNYYNSKSNKKLKSQKLNNKKEKIIMILNKRKIKIKKTTI